MLSNRWFILSIIFAARLSMGYQFQSIGSVSPSLIKEFALEYAAIGTLIGLQSLPGLFLSLPSGFLGNRFGDKRVVLFGLALMTIGTALIGISHSFTIAATGRLISGIGAILLNVLMTKMIVDWFTGKEIITAMAVFVNSWPVGIGIALVTQPAIDSVLGWPAVFYISASFSAGGLFIIATFYRHPGVGGKQIAVGGKVRLSVIQIYLITLAALIWAFYNGAYIILPNFGPPLLSSKGIAFVEAAVLLSVCNWLVIGSVPLGGWLAQKLGRPNLFMVTGFMLFGLAMLLLPFGPPFPLIVSIGIIGGLPAGSIMALPAAVLHPQSRALGMGLFWTIYYGVYAALPPLAGLILDFTKSTDSPLFLGAGLLFVSMAILACFRLTQIRPQTFS